MKLLLQSKWNSLILIVIAFSLIYNPLTKFLYHHSIYFSRNISIKWKFKYLNFKNLDLRAAKIIVISYIRVRH
jgi:hypothetical protein